MGQTNQKQIWESCVNKNDSVFVTTEKDLSAHQDTSLILWFLNDEERRGN